MDVSNGKIKGQIFKEIIYNDKGVTRLIRVKVINYVTNNMDMFDDVCDCGLENTNDQTNTNIRTSLNTRFWITQNCSSQNYRNGNPTN